MSRTIDQQVVEMQFDNSHFERNVKQSMSTIDRFKQSLNLTGASKGLENINAAARKNNFGVLGSSIEAVKVKFSAMEIAGITALTNITNSAVNAGKRIVKALTIDPVTTGFNEYELKMGAIQTIMSSTGESLETVTKYLNELNEYSDRTIYSFSDMTQNIGKFTNAGVKLEDAVLAMKGISNEAALSGANANEASRAMYNLSQALSMGYVQYIDWKSIENANMATVSFKEELIKTALQLEVVKKTGDNAYTTLEGKTYNMMGMFKDGMKDQWLTSEVLIETLKQYADETTDIGEKAYKAATEIKTFTQMLDTLKESAQSGWAHTWEIMFGGFYEAKDLWTDMGGAIDNMLGGMSKARNSILKTALGSSWEDLTDQIEEAGLSAGDFSKVLRKVMLDAGEPVEDLEKEYSDLSVAIKAGKVSATHIRKTLDKVIETENKTVKATGKVTLSIEELQKVADRVMDGAFGNGAKRMKALAEAGYDYATVQNKVNEILGSSVRHVSELTEEQKAQLATYANMTDAQRENANLTGKQVTALAELDKMAQAAGGSVNDLISDLERPSGRMLLLESFKNIWGEIQKIFEAIGEAWTNAFGEFDTEETGNKLYNLIADFKEFTETLDVNETALGNFSKVLEGIFKTSGVTFKIFGTSLLSALTLLNAIFKVMGTDLLEVAGMIGDKMIALADYFNVNFVFSTKHIDHLANILVSIYEGIKNCVLALFDLERAQGIIERFTALLTDLFGSANFFDIVEFFSPAGIVQKIKDFFVEIEAWVKGIDSAENVGQYIVDGIVDGMGGAIKGIFDVVVKIADAIITTFCDIFGIQSPSRLMMSFGGFIIAGLLLGLMQNEGKLGSFISKFGSTMVTMFENLFNSVVDFAKELDFGKLVAIGLSTGLIFTIKKLADAIALFGAPLDAFAGMCKAIKGAFKDVGDALTDAIKMRSRTEAIKSIAISLLVLSGALWVVAQIPTEKLLPAVGAIFALAAVMFALTAACAKLNKIDGIGINYLTLLSIAGAFLALAAAFKIMSTIDAEQIGTTILGFTTVFAGIVGMMWGLGQVSKGAEKLDFKGLGRTFVGISVALLLMIGVIKLASMLTIGEIVKGTIAIGLIGVLFYNMAKACATITAADSIKNVGGMIFKMSAAILLIVGAIKLISMLKIGELVKGGIVIAAIGYFFYTFTKYMSTITEDVHLYVAMGNLAKLMLGFGGAMLMIAAAMRIIAGMSVGDLIKASLVVIAMGALCEGLIWFSKFSGEHAHKAGLMLIEFGAALLIMSLVLLLLKEICSDAEGLNQAIDVIFQLGLVFAGLIAVTALAKEADKVKGVLITLTVAIGILAVAIVALSMLDRKDVATAGLALSGVIAMFAALIAATSLIKGTGADLFGAIGVIVLLGLLVGYLATIIRDLASLEPERVISTAEALGVLLLSLSASVWMLGHLKGLKKEDLIMAVAVVGALSLLCAALLTMLRDIQLLNPEGAIPTAIAIGTLLLALSSAFWIISHGKSISIDDMLSIVAIIGVMAIAIEVIGHVLSKLDGINPGNAIGAATAIGEVLLALSGAFWVISHGKSISIEDMLGIVPILGTMMIAIEVIAHVIEKLQNVSPENAIGSATAIGLLLLTLSASFWVISHGKSISLESMLSIVAILGMFDLAILAIGSVIKKLENVQPGNAIGAATAIGLVLLALSGAFWVMSHSSTINVSTLPGLITALLLMTGVIGISSKFIAELSKCNAGGAIASALALGILINALAIAMLPLSLVGMFGTQAVVGALALTAMAVPLAAFAYTMSKMQPVSSGVVDTITTLTMVMAAMTVLLFPLAAIGAIMTTGIGAVAILAGIGALCAMVLPLAIFMEEIQNWPDISASIPTINALVDIMVKMAELMIEIGILGPLALVGLGCLGGIIAIVEMFMVFAGVLGALVTEFPSLQKFVDTGIDLLVRVGEGMGEITGAFVVGLGDKIFGSLPGYGESLGKFISHISGFISKVQALGEDTTLVTGAKNLAEAIIAISDAANSTTLLGSSLPEVGAQLRGFMSADLKQFFTDIKDVPADAVNNINTIAQTVTALAQAAKDDWWTKVFSGGTSDWTKLGEKLAAFGSAMVEFDKSIAGYTFDQAAVEAVKGGAEIMIELQKALVPTGSFIDTFRGEKDLGDFGNQMKYFGQGIKGFSDAVTGGLDTKAMEQASSIGTTMANLQSSIDPVNGLAQKLTGTTDLEEFGENIEAYAKALKTACNVFVQGDGTNGLNTEGITKAKDVGTALAELQGSIPTDKWFDGKVSLDEFGQKIYQFGQYIRSYSNELTDVDNDKMTRSTIWARSLTQVVQDISSINPDSLSNISKVKEVGTVIKEFASGMAEASATDFDASGMINRVVNSISTAFDDRMDKLKSMGSDVVSSIINGMDPNADSLINKAAKITAAIIKALKSNDAKNNFKEVGKEFVLQISKGLGDTAKKADVVTAAKLVATNAAGENGIKQKTVYDKYKEAGKYCVQGFAQGISDNASIAKTAATNLANSIKRTINSVLQIMSPSRVFMKTGKYIVEGLAKGITNNTRTAIASTVDMADGVTGGFSRAIGRITDLLSGEMETQPTIRPVLDLSDIESGASRIGSMFGNPSVGVMTNFGSINTMMNRRNQNGINDDVVEAINNLGSLLGMSGGNSYTINGITYDDGSAISDAVNALIRATRIEGRV